MELILKKIEDLEERISELEKPTEKTVKFKLSGKDLHGVMEPELVSFGNYLLSKERNENLINETNANCVTHADLENWKAK